MPPSDPSRVPRVRHPLAAGMLLLFRIGIGVIILLDELVHPLYVPLLRRISALALVRRFERWVGGLPPLAVLVLIGVPYLVVEPVKVVALVRIADGHVKTGIAVLLLAFLVSFVVIERIYTAGRTQLMTLRPVAFVIETAGAVRDWVARGLRLAELKAWVRATWRRLRRQLRLLLR